MKFSHEGDPLAYSLWWRKRSSIGLSDFSLWEFGWGWHSTIYIYTTNDADVSRYADDVLQAGERSEKSSSWSSSTRRLSDSTIETARDHYTHVCPLRSGLYGELKRECSVVRHG